MFDKLIDLFIEFIELFKFWAVIDTYEKGVVLQFGKYRRTLDSGLHFVVPFGIDSVLVDNVVLKTMDMGTQSLVTDDNINVVISSFVTYKIVDIKTFLCEVESAEDVIMSVVYGVISRMVGTEEFSGLFLSVFRNQVFLTVKEKLSIHGVEVLAIDFQNITDSKTIRHLTDDINLSIDNDE